jgi:chemotaxis protein methyltransferase CheR
MTGALGREFVFSDKHFKLLRKFVTAHTGIVLTEAKKDMVYSRLSKRIRKQFAGSFDDFCKAITDGDAAEQDFLINAITTNLTAFFREPHHFDYLRREVIPALIEQNRSSKRIRVWSAGCSTGEEAYTIAICLRETLKNIDDWDIKILATDLDANVLAHGKDGVYTSERISGLEQKIAKTWFKQGSGQNDGLVKVSPDLAKMIVFKRLNLLHGWPMKGPFDVIFCRNVVIYFDKDTQAELFDRYADILKPEGHLFIGHSESLYKVCDRFASLGHTIYRRLY